MPKRKLRFLIDVDEVLADFVSPMLAIAKLVTGRDIVIADCPVWDLFSLFSTNEIKDIHAEISRAGYCLNLKPREGAKAAVQRLRELVAIYPVTSPYPSDHWMRERDQWLEGHFSFDRREVVYTEAKYLVRGDAFLDDNPRHVSEWSEEHPDGFSMLLLRPNTKNLPTTAAVRRVTSWQEVIQNIESLVERHDDPC